MSIRFMVWDFREAPTAERFAEEIRAFGGGPVYAAAVDAGTDDYILALSGQPITPSEGLAAWLAQTS